MQMTEALGTRILRATMELRMLEADLRAITEVLHDSPESWGALAPGMDGKIAAEFRDALDRTRHALWPFAASKSRESQGTAAAMMGYRMARVAEMLSALRAAGREDLTAAGASHGFIEQVQAMAALTLEKHLADKTPAA